MTGINDALVFKTAEEPWELEQVYRLNYRTFVEEIPQHDPNPERRLVDRLLDHSTCFIGLAGRQVVGMIAVSDQRPFSLDRKLRDLDLYLPPARRPCELRLLSVEKEHRRGVVFKGLFRLAVRHAQENDYDLAVISATESQIRLYRHIGFVPFGPPLGTPAAPFQGMYLSWERLADSAYRLLDDD